MALSQRVTSFGSATTGGNQSVTGIGFQPKVLLFFLGDYLLTDDEVGHSSTMIGFCTSPTNRVVGSWSGEGSASASDYNVRLHNAKAISYVNVGGVVKLEADLVSMDSDGFTLNWTTTAFDSDVICVVALGGSDLTNAQCGYFPMQNALGNQAVTGLGFKPDGVIFWSPCNTTSIPTTQSKNTGGSFGFATVVGGVVQQGYTGHRAVDGASTSQTASRQMTNKCVAFPSNTGVSSEGALASLDTDGFTINWTTAGGSDNIFYLAIKGPSFRVGSFNQPTSLGNQTINVGLDPDLIILSSFNKVASTATSNDCELSIGLATGPSNRACLWRGDKNGVTGSMVCRAALDRTKVMQMWTAVAGGSTKNAEATVYSMSSGNAFVLNWTLVDATARQILYLAVGAAPTGATIDLAGTSATASTGMTGSLNVDYNLAGVSASVAAEVPTLSVAWVIAGTSISVAAEVAAVVLSVGLQSTINNSGNLAVNATVAGGQLAGIITGTVTEVANLGTTVRMIGVIDATVEETPNLTVNWGAKATFVVVADLNDEEQPLTVDLGLIGTSVSVGTLIGDFSGSGWQFGGSSDSVATVTGNLSGQWKLEADPINVRLNIQEATLELPQFLSGSIVATTSGNIKPPIVTKFGGPALFEDFIKWPSRQDVLLAIVEMAEILSRFSKDLLYTRVYTVDFPSRVGTEDIEGGILRLVTRVEEDGVPLTRVNSSGDVETLRGSYFYDEAFDELSIHSFRDTDDEGQFVTPDQLGLTIVAFFNTYFSSDAVALEINGRVTPFIPLITDDSFAKMSLEVEDPLFGVKRIPDGMIGLLNYNGFMSRFYSKYRWKNKQVQILLGGTYNQLELPFSEYKSLGVYLTEDLAPDEDTVQFKLVGQQSILLKTVPVTAYTDDEYPNAGSGVLGTFKPIWYGLNTVKPDLVNGGTSDAPIPGEYLLADPAYQTMFNVVGVQGIKRDTGQTVGLSTPTDYIYLPSANLLVITNPTYKYQDYEIVVTAYGKPTPDHGDYLHLFAEIVYDLVTTFARSSTSDFDIDLACQCLQDNQDELHLYLKQPISLLEILQNQQEERASLERSAMGVLDMMENGLWRLRIWSSAFNPSELPRLVKHDFATFVPRTKLETIFWRVEVYYDYNYARQEWKMAYAESPATRFGDGSEEVLKVYTNLKQADAAQRLAQRYRFLSSSISLQIQCSEIGVKMINQRAGDKIVVSYDPAPSVDKEFDEELFEIESIVQSFSKPPSVEFRLGNLRGIGNRIGFWVGPGTPIYTNATTGERSQSGYWSDSNGRANSSDLASENISRWW